MMSSASAVLAFATASAASAAPNCTFVPFLDYNGGDVATHVVLPPPDSTRQARCCALCAANPDCHAGILTGPSRLPAHACWLKGGDGSLKTTPDVMSCWKPGAKPPPPGWMCNATSWQCYQSQLGGLFKTEGECSSKCEPPPPPPPQCYKASVTKFDPKPVLSAVDGSSSFQQVLNPRSPSIARAG